MNLPRYRCHKVVQAVKIAQIYPDQRPTFKGRTCRGCFALNSACGNCERCDWETSHPGRPGATIVPEGPGVPSLRVEAAYLEKHKPVVGGYFVVYDDGYQSFSPAFAFEAGYERIIEV